MTKSNLVSYTRISPNTSGIRGQNVSKVTVHHMAGDCSVETCGEIFANPSRQASSNYGVGSDGRVACYLEEEYHPWTSSSYWNDDRAVTIEVADYDTDEWSPSEEAYNATVELCADICTRYGIEPIYTGDTDGTFTEHMMFASTSCPGPWWHRRMPQFIEDVKAAMEGEYMALSDNDIQRIWEYIYHQGKSDEDKVLGPGKYSNRYNVLNNAYIEAHKANERIDALEEKLGHLEIGGIALDYSEMAKAVNDDAAKRMKE